jgi:hypothetical protein
MSRPWGYAKLSRPKSLFPEYTNGKNIRVVLPENIWRERGTAESTTIGVRSPPDELRIFRGQLVDTEKAAAPAK